MSDDLTARLLDLARSKHDDLSVATEAADEIERLRAENAKLRKQQVEVLSSVLSSFGYTVEMPTDQTDGEPPYVRVRMNSFGVGDD